MSGCLTQPWLPLFKGERSGHIMQTSSAGDLLLPQPLACLASAQIRSLHPMTSVWAKVISGLDALLRHTSPAALGLSDDATKWERLTNVSASLKAAQPTAAEKAEIIR